MQQDKALIKIVHSEDRESGLQVRAILTRFGGLAVFVTDRVHNIHWQGENVLEARDFAARAEKALTDFTGSK